MVGKAKWKPIKLPLPGKTVNQKQFHIPGGTAEIMCHYQALERCRDGDLTILPLTILSCQYRRQRMAVDYQKLSQW